MEEIKITDLMAVEQKPIIAERLALIKSNIETATADVLSMECNEDTYKAVKRAKSELNKQFKELEDGRKLIKKTVMQPYEDFERIYKENITDVFNPAIKQISNKVLEVEDGLKNEKREKAVSYFNELATSLGIDFVTFDDVNVVVNMSVSLKKLNEASESFLNQITADLAFISTQEHTADVFVEYKKTLNVTGAIMAVQQRYKAIEEEERRIAEQEKLARQEAEREAEIEKVVAETISAPTVESEPEEVPVQEKVQEPEQDVVPVEAEKLLKVNFSVIGTKAQLKELIRFMKERGLKYEQQ